MAFRVDESASNGFKEVRNYLISKNIEASERERSENKLIKIIDNYGPVVRAYPSWHPLVAHHDGRIPARFPNTDCGYKGLDHTIYFVNAFISCPYDDGQDIIDSVQELPYSHIATINAERLDVQLYQPDATPILVTCDWRKSISNDRSIPASIAIPLMLQKELPSWVWAEVGETWETMRPYFLGSPHGSRSSHFVSQETALTMKKVWNLLINTGMFGPIYVARE